MENYFATCIKNHNIINENTVDLISLTKTPWILNPLTFSRQMHGVIMLYYVELFKDIAETFFCCSLYPWEWCISLFGFFKMEHS